MKLKHPIYNCQFWSYKEQRFLSYDKWIQETW